ncbi:hypothetical protein Aperf_G00000089368 [Anoplocephala perfoliata]
MGLQVTSPLSFFYLLIWCHEHGCCIVQERNERKRFYVVQPSSSVVTALSESGVVSRYAGLLEIQGYKLQILLMRSVGLRNSAQIVSRQPPILATEEVYAVLRRLSKKQERRSPWNLTSSPTTEPLFRLRVDTSSGFEKLIKIGNAGAVEEYRRETRFFLRRMQAAFLISTARNTSVLWVSSASPYPPFQALSFPSHTLISSAPQLPKEGLVDDVNVRGMKDFHSKAHRARTVAFHLRFHISNFYFEFTTIRLDKLYAISESSDDVIFQVSLGDFLSALAVGLATALAIVTKNRDSFGKIHTVRSHISSTIFSLHDPDRGLKQHDAAFSTPGSLANIPNFHQDIHRAICPLVFTYIEACVEMIR